MTPQCDTMLRIAYFSPTVKETFKKSKFLREAVPSSKKFTKIPLYKSFLLCYTLFVIRIIPIITENCLWNKLDDSAGSGRPSWM